MTLIPWSESKSLTWDFTVVCGRHAGSVLYLQPFVHARGEAAESAAEGQTRKYESISRTHRSRVKHGYLGKCLFYDAMAEVTVTVE